MKMSVMLRQHFWKTKMCPLFLENRCKEGENCDYAHCVEDLRTIPDLRRTKLCHKLLKGDKCFNKKCNYAHTQEELKSAQNLFAYKSSMCKFIGTNNCLNGSTCRFAHFVEELRIPRAPDILLEQNNSQMGIQNCTDINNLTNNNHNNINKDGDTTNQIELNHNINNIQSDIDMIRKCDSRNMRNGKISTQNNFMDKNNLNNRGKKDRKDLKYRNNKTKDKTNKSMMNQYYQVDSSYIQREPTEVYTDYGFCVNKIMNSNTTNYDNVNYNIDLIKYNQDRTEVTYEDVQMHQCYEEKEIQQRKDSIKIEKELNKMNEMDKEKCEDNISEKTYTSQNDKDNKIIDEEQKKEYDNIENYNNNINNINNNLNLIDQTNQLNLNYINNKNQFRNENIPTHPLYQQYPMPIQYSYPYILPYYNNNVTNNANTNNTTTTTTTNNNNNDDISNNVNPLQFVVTPQIPNPMCYYYYYPYYNNNVQINPISANNQSQTTVPSVNSVDVIETNNEIKEVNNKKEDIDEENDQKMNSGQSIEYVTKDIKENMTQKSCENSSVGVVEENVTCAFEVYRDQIVYSKLDEKLIEEINKKSKQKNKKRSTQFKKILSQSIQLKLNCNEIENNTKEENNNNKLDINISNKNKELNNTDNTNDQNNEMNIDLMLKKKQGATPSSVYSYISNANINNEKYNKDETPLISPVIPLGSASVIPNNMNYHMNIPMNNYNMNNYNMYNQNYPLNSPYYYGSPYIYNNDQIYKC